MTATPDVRERLKNLTIAQEQRPVSRAEAPRRAVRRYGTVLVAAAAIVIAGYLSRNYLIGLAGFPRAQAREVPLMVVAESKAPGIEPVLTATGKIVSDHLVQVATKVSGQIVELYFEQGDTVRQGQLLARIEDVAYRARRNEAKARLAQAEANLAFQEINFARVASLIDDQAAPPIEYAQAKRGLDEARAQVVAGHAALDYAQKGLDDCNVVAPISGVILHRNVEVGDFVAAEGGIGANANARFAEIADMETLRVEVDISELDIARIRRGMPCIVTPDAYKNRRYDGFVMWIDPGANYSKATVQAKVRIVNPDEFLRVEGSAQVEFFVENPDENREDAGAIWIPAAACRELDESARRATVLVVELDRIRETSVSLGRRRGHQVEVTAGLSPGQTIVAAAETGLSDGQSITNRSTPGSG